MKALFSVLALIMFVMVSMTPTVSASMMVPECQHGGEGNFLSCTQNWTGYSYCCTDYEGEPFCTQISQQEAANTFGCD